MAESSDPIPDIAVAEQPPSSPDDDQPASSRERTSGKKREREVSLEPSVADAVANEQETGSRGRGTKPKKNRTSALLDVSGSDEDSSPPRSAGAIVVQDSPMGPKVKMIGKRVQDLSWTDKASSSSLPSPMKGVSTSKPNDKDSIKESSSALQETQDTPRDKQDTSKGDSGDAKDILDVDTLKSPKLPQASAMAEEAELTAEVDEVPDLPTSAPHVDEAVPRTSTDKSLKRKSRDSVFFSTGGEEPVAEPHKRQKDDLKSPRASTSEEIPKEPVTPARSKSPGPTNSLNGFSSYSSGPSPFARATATSSIFDDAPALPTAKRSFASFGVSNFANKFSSAITSKSPARTTSPPPKITFGTSGGGFASFASKPSPFAAARANTPPTSNSNESLGFSGFATKFGGGSAFTSGLGSKASSSSAQKAAAKSKPEDSKSGDEDDETQDTVVDNEEAGDDKRETSFSDILAADTGGDEDEDSEATKRAANLEAIELHTGEEDERTLQQFRAKLYTLDSSDSYKERGTGSLKLNVRRSDGRGARLIMRADGVLRLLMNASLFNGMPCTIGQDPKFIKLSTIENGAFVHHAIKVGNPKTAQTLYDLINENLPDSTSSPPSENKELPAGDEAV